MPTIVDIHPHIISPDTERYPPAPLFGKKSDWATARPISFEQLIVAMDEAGVDKAAIVQASTYYGYDNSYVVDAVAPYPGRFAAVCCIDVLAPDARDTIHKWVDRGMAGIRLYTGGTTGAIDGSWLDDSRSYPAWELAGELGQSICVQTNAAGLPHLENMLKRFPQVRVIIDHLARPKIEDGSPYAAASSLFDLAAYPNLYLKISPRNFVDSSIGRATPETFFPLLVTKFGADRIAWGSNCPSSEGKMSDNLVHGKRCLASLSERERQLIFGETALGLYPALAD